MTKEEILDCLGQYAEGALSATKWGDYGFLISLHRTVVLWSEGRNRSGDLDYFSMHWGFADNAGLKLACLCIEKILSKL